MPLDNKYQLVIVIISIFCLTLLTVIYISKIQTAIYFKGSIRINHIFHSPRAEKYPELKHNLILTVKNCQICYNYSKLIKLLPKKDVDPQLVFGSPRNCAIVASARQNQLKGYRYGQSIDSHDIVMRLNNHISLNKEDYGRKTSHRYINNRVVSDSPGFIRNRPEIIIVGYYNARWHNIKLGLLSVQLPKFRCQTPAARQFKYYMDAYIERRNDSEPYIIHGDFLDKAHDTFTALNKGSVKHCPSTGWFACFLLSYVCPDINLFGFTPQSGWHDYDNEHRLIHKLNKLNGSIKFYP